MLPYEKVLPETESNKGNTPKIEKVGEREQVCKHVCYMVLSCEPLDPATPEVFWFTSFINRCILFLLIGLWLSTERILSRTGLRKAEQGNTRRNGAGTMDCESKSSAFGVVRIYRRWGDSFKCKEHRVMLRQILKEMKKLSLKKRSTLISWASGQPCSATKMQYSLHCDMRYFRWRRILLLISKEIFYYENNFLQTSSIPFY